MATVFSHALVGATIVVALPPKYRTPLNYRLAALTAVLPDFDYLGFVARVPYDSLWGHRGMTHSILFALLVGAVASWLASRKISFRHFLLFFATTISHPLLDACTNGGRGVAFFAPYNTFRYFFPWRPIQVSPMGFSFFSERGLVVLISELYWIVLPSLVIFLLRKSLIKLKLAK